MRVYMLVTVEFNFTVDITPLSLKIASQPAKCKNAIVQYIYIQNIFVACSLTFTLLTKHYTVQENI